jgi:hypothetical protein
MEWGSYVGGWEAAVLRQQGTGVLAAHGAVADTVLLFCEQVGRLKPGIRCVRTDRGGQSDSLGKVIVKRTAPQRQPPVMLSGRVVSVMALLESLLCGGSLEITRTA